MRKLLSFALALMILTGLCTDAFATSDYDCSAWLAYWDAESALKEAHAFPDSFSSLVCF